MTNAPAQEEEEETKEVQQEGETDEKFKARVR